MNTEPSITQTAFSCPHCGAYATQYWYSLRAEGVGGNTRLPIIPTHALRKKIESGDLREDKAILEWCDKGMSGLVFLENGQSEYLNLIVINLHLSKCFNCEKIAVWVHENLLFPAHKTGVKPNVDLPDDITKDFEEARSIVDASPRGAAALLRLCVQKLCKFLGEKGKNIDDDIAALVKKGLNPIVQKSLDIVRVIGNDSVHPGKIDLNDNKETALRLFELVNAIVDQMVSHPKTVDEMYAKLPAGKREAIEKRDRKAE